MAETLSIVLLLAGLAGLAIPVGGGLAYIEHIRGRELREEVRHAVMAFGGGVLLAAVALVLVPEGMRDLPLYWIILTFLGGAAVFLYVDRLIQRSRATAAQTMAMLLDFVPEAIALGAAFGSGGRVGPLLALLIGLQNLPEGFNAYRELRQSGFRVRRTHLTLCSLALLGPLAGALGLLLLADRAALVGGLMLFAAGGILYLMFQDIAPQARLRRRFAPALGAVAGFLAGIVGHSFLM